MNIVGSLAVILLLFAGALLLSVDRKAIRPRIVASAFALQFLIALATLRFPAGREALATLGEGVEALLGYARPGTEVLFGEKIVNDGLGGLVVNLLPIIIFFSALIAVLYHIRLMPIIIRVVGGFLRKIIGVSNVEALFGAANIFMGQTESPLTIRPYVPHLTKSQLFAVMTTGMAGVAGTILAAYVQLGVRMEFLLAASFMAAPAGLVMAKIIVPDVPGQSPKQLEQVTGEFRQEANLITAISEGAHVGLKIAAALAAMLMAFIALIALANGLLAVVTGWFGIEGLTFQRIVGAPFVPIMWALGLSWPDAQVAGSLFGEKIVLNEFIAYLHYVKVASELSNHDQAVITFALCGFANLGSIAVQMAVLGAIAPERRELVSRLGPRALAAASLANLSSAALASLLVP